MADSKRRADSLGLYLTGAGSDGGAQADPDLSLGGFRSSTEVRQLGAIVNTPVAPLIIEAVLGANTSGTGTLTATGASNVTWNPPGAAVGSAVAILAGEEKLIESATDSQAIRISRDSLPGFAGNMILNLVEPFNGVIGAADIPSAERTAGVDQYRAVMLRAHGIFGVLNTQISIGTLGTQATSDAGQLPGAGAGTITTTASLADWPDTGWAHIRTSGGATREIVYYTSRTATVLTVSVAGHRGRLGTSAAAGAATDTIDAVPGIRMGGEVPAGDGSIQTIADENTAPGGVVFTASLTAAGGVNIVTIDTLNNHGLWFHKEIPAAAIVSAKSRNVFNLAYLGA